MSDYLRALETRELAAEAIISELLRPLLDIASSVLSHVSTIVVLTQRSVVHPPSLVQHMLLKQATMSLRAASHLLVKGYTTQAATVVSGLYELALYSDFIQDDPVRADTFLNHPNSQDFVWPPKKMIRQLAQRRLKAKGKVNDPIALKNAIEDIDLPYIYLCSLKHNNPIPLRHTIASQISEAERAAGISPFAVVPDTRPEDNLVKIVILAQANEATVAVATNAAHTAERQSQEWFDWLARLVEIRLRNSASYLELGQRFGPMPFPTVRKQVS